MVIDYEYIFREFNKQKIQYIVVGGLAVNLLGIPRITYDIDILARLNDQNLKKLLALLKKWGLRPRVPVDMMDFAVREKRENWIKNKNMKAFNLRNEKLAIEEIDILIDTPVSFEEADKNKIIVKLGNLSIPVISENDLIKMKKNTGRDQDKADIESLRKKIKKYGQQK